MSKPIRQILQSGFVEHQFEIYVSKTNKVIVWIHSGICNAVFMQSGEIHSMIMPCMVKETESIKAIAHAAAMDLIANYFDEGIEQQILRQIKK